MDNYLRMNSASQVDLSIIIVNWNSKAYTFKCIQSILFYIKKISYEIIVVDNASFDGCGEMLTESFPNVMFLQSQFNGGFASANNLGVSHAHGNTFLFLNPDTYPHHNAIEKLYKQFCILSNAGAVGCKLLNSDGTLQTSCVQSIPTILNQVFDSNILRRIFPTSRLWGVSAFFGPGTIPAKVEAVSGACIMISRVAFERVSGFSQDYFMYAEDIDLCYKCIQAGFSNYYIPSVSIIHHGGGSSLNQVNHFSITMMRESINRFFAKRYGSAHSNIYRLTQAANAGIRLLILLLSLPVFIFTRKIRDWRLSTTKWFFILRWCIRLEE